MSDAPRQLSNARVSVLALNSTGPIAALAMVQLDSTGGILGSAGGSTQVSIKGMFSLDGSTSLLDSTQNSIGVTIREGSVSATLVTVRQSSAADLQMTATPAAGSTWAVRPLQSSAADLQMTATPAAGSTWAVRPLQSSQADLRMTAYQSTAADFNGAVVQGSTVWVTQPRLFTSSGGGVEGSTTTLSTGGVLGLNIRAVQPSGRQSTSLLVNIGTAGGSTALISSVAALKHKVYAFSVMSTVIAPSSVAFLSSAATERWGLILGSGSSGVTGANLAVTPPGFLFETVTAEALNFSASSTGLYRVSLAWFTEA